MTKGNIIMNRQTKKPNQKWQALLQNIGIGYYNFKTKPEVATTSEKEILTTVKMKSLFGASYDNIVYYNFDTDVWNRSKYLGFTMGNQSIDARNAIEMKRMVEMEPEMQDLEVVASVTMSTTDAEYPGNGNVAAAVKYKRDRNIVGTLVLRDKTTGKILPVVPCWLGVEDYSKISVAAFYGADGLAYKLANNGQLRRTFISELARQVQR